MFLNPAHVQAQIASLREEVKKDRHRIEVAQAALQAVHNKHAGHEEQISLLERYLRCVGAYVPQEGDDAIPVEQLVA